MEPKYKIGDNVRVVLYGHIIMSCMPIPNHLDIPPIVDYIESLPQIINCTGVVDKVSPANEYVSHNSYAVEGIPLKYAWYNEDQLELA